MRAERGQRGVWGGLEAQLRTNPLRAAFCPTFLGCSVPGPAGSLSMKEIAKPAAAAKRIIMSMNSLPLAAEHQQASPGSDLSQKQSPLLNFHGKKTQGKDHYEHELFAAGCRAPAGKSRIRPFSEATSSSELSWQENPEEASSADKPQQARPQDIHLLALLLELTTGKQGNQYPREMVQLTIPGVEVKWSAAPSRVRVELPHHHRKGGRKRREGERRSALDIWAGSRKKRNGRVGSGGSSCEVPSTPNTSVVAANRPSRAPALAE